MSAFTGKSAFDEADRRSKTTGSRRAYLDFYLKVGESKEVVFCDDEPEVVNGHRLMIDGRFPRWVTCSQGQHDCMFCERKITRSWIGPMTVIDTTSATGKDGKVYKNEKKLLLAGGRSLAMLKLKKENRFKADKAGLVNGLFSIARVSKQSSFDDCEFLKRVTPADIGVPDFAPLSYAVLLAAPARDEQEDMFKHQDIADWFRPKGKPLASDSKGTPTDSVKY